ncbi:MAG: hypothetical protein QUS11_03515 [Candidatus Fermentibacter sp.]|nr:hypothetical protein [Candidatus Fermentibacter sp.]
MPIERAQARPVTGPPADRRYPRGRAVCIIEPVPQGGRLHDPYRLGEQVLKIAIGTDRGGWHRRFAEAVERRALDRPGLEYGFVNLDRSDWLARVAGATLVIWKPPYMGHEFAGYVKEKIHFLEHHAGLTVVPGFETVWHFESKAAQSYLLSLAGIPTPRTFVTFDYDEAAQQAGLEEFPVVLKGSAGAGSVNVRAVRSREELMGIVRRAFSLTLWDRTAAGGRGRLSRLASGIGRDWFADFLRRRRRGEQPFGVAYWQEFVPGNDADLRITAIGDSFATGFWRNNRPGDFRASGSGRIDYDRPVPEEAMLACLGINRRFGFDSMAYDILFRDGRMLVSEMSYGYSDSAVHGVAGYWRLESPGCLRFVEGHTWPQDLWVDWAISKADAASGARAGTASPGGRDPER